MAPPPLMCLPKKHPVEQKKTEDQKNEDKERRPRKKDRVPATSRDGNLGEGFVLIGTRLGEVMGKTSNSLERALQVSYKEANCARH